MSLNHRVFRGPATDVEAQQVTAGNAVAVALWCGGEVLTDGLDEPRGILVHRMHGDDFAHIGDYIIRNKFFSRSIPADFFEDTYHEIADPTPHTREQVTAGYRAEPDRRDKHSEEL